MGHFKEIQLLNFRNFESYKIDFSKNCNVLFGKNGTGKTNLIEAISLFGKGRGIRKDHIKNLIKKNKNSFSNLSKFEDKSINYEIRVISENLNTKFFKRIFIDEDSSKVSIDNVGCQIS